MKYMLDTNICIYIIKKHPALTLKKFTELKMGEVCLSSISLSELMYGVQKSQYTEKNNTALKEFTFPLNILPFNEEAAKYYGGIRAYLEKEGTPIGSLDMLIAAHAVSLNLILVTNNTKEFSRIPHLILEDWTQY